MPNPENGPQIPAIRWPVPKNNRGGEFSNLEEMLAHLEGEAAGHWLIGRNGMWHGGIHISDATIPWCALCGQAMNEAADFPVPVTGSMSLKTGDRVWTVCDKGNLVPARESATRPAWWSPFLPPSRETMQFDTVVCPTPYPIKAGDPAGHLGYFQVPSEDGHEKRYQVHIECLTTDDLPHFLSNLFCGFHY